MERLPSPLPSPRPHLRMSAAPAQPFTNVDVVTGHVSNIRWLAKRGMRSIGKPRYLLTKINDFCM
jgi:hypothetical protein